MRFFFVLPKEYQLIDIDKIMELENHIKVIITVKLIPLKILKGAKTSGHNWIQVRILRTLKIVLHKIFIDNKGNRITETDWHHVLINGMQY